MNSRLSTTRSSKFGDLESVGLGGSVRSVPERRNGRWWPKIHRSCREGEPPRVPRRGADPNRRGAIVLRHLLCLLPTWSAHRILELVPAFWAQTAQRDEVTLALEANPFRRATDIQPDGI